MHRAALPLVLASLCISAVYARQGRDVIGVQVRASNDTAATTGDTQCVPLMCISAVVDGSTVQYTLQSSGSQPLGWMAMGFGSTMANSPMVILWPNPDASITLSQRMAPAEVEPSPVAAPPRIASVAAGLSVTNGTTPRLTYTIPANTDTQQHVIWAFGTTPPGSPAPSANLIQHLDSGTFVLDLTKPLSSAPSSNSSAPISGGGGGGGESTRTNLIIAHALLCTLGFLLFLPAGVLIARFLRTFTDRWFTAHWVVQAGVSAPVIIAGIALGIRAVALGDKMHFNDTHKKTGLALLLLYLAQLALGALIHLVKRAPRSAPKNQRRPPQNYAHALLGLALIALAFWQVRTGYAEEWPRFAGRGALPRGVGVVWVVWVVGVPGVYAVGLGFGRWRGEGRRGAGKRVDSSE